MTQDDEHVTRIMKQAAAGDRLAAAQLLPLVYDELRKLARARLAKTPPGNTLQPTALVHEAYLELIKRDGRDPGWDSRGHFFGAAAQAMRDILVDQARRKGRIKAGGGRTREELNDAALPMAIAEPSVDMIKLDAVLKELEALDPRKAQVVMLRYFAGLSNEHVAAALNVTERTVERDWRFVKAFVAEKLGETLKDDGV